MESTCQNIWSGDAGVYCTSPMHTYRGLLAHCTLAAPFAVLRNTSLTVDWLLIHLLNAALKSISDDTLLIHHWYTVDTLLLMPLQHCWNTPGTLEHTCTSRLFVQIPKCTSVAPSLIMASTFPKTYRKKRHNHRHHQYFHHTRQQQLYVHCIKVCSISRVLKVS